MAILVEMVVEGGVDVAELLQGLHLRNLSMARSHRRKGGCEFSTLLLAHLLTPCLSELPSSFIAAL